MQVIRMVRAVFAKPDEEAVKAEAERIERERQGEALAEMMRESGEGATAAKGTSNVGELGDVMAFIAREKAKSASSDNPSTPAAPTDEMSSVMAFIAREKAKLNKDD